MGRKRNIANIYDAPKSNVQFTEGQKSKGILDDFAVRGDVATKEGTIEHVPTNDNHITNKKYVDNAGLWEVENTQLTPKTTTYGVAIAEEERIKSPATGTSNEIMLTTDAWGVGGTNNMSVQSVNNVSLAIDSNDNTASSAYLDIGKHGKNPGEVGWESLIHVEETGNVGIGTDTPGDPLQVLTSLYVDNAGQVGVGRSPTKTFDVHNIGNTTCKINATQTASFDLSSGVSWDSTFRFLESGSLRFSLFTDNTYDDNLYIHANSGNDTVIQRSTGNWIMGGTTPVTKLHVIGNTRLGDQATNYAQFASDGELSLTGTARVTECMWLSAGGLKAPGAKPATFVECGLTGVWQFANAIEANQESVSGTLKIPCNMDRTVAPLFHLGWHTDTASDGNAKWQLEYLWVGANDDTCAAAQDTHTETSASSATADGLVFVTFDPLELPTSTDLAMLWKITRLSGDVADTVEDTVEMRGCAFTRTVNKLGVAT